MKALILILMAITISFVSFAQKNKENTKTTKTATSQAQYCCAMHPEVISNKPGKCSKCNMDLTTSKKEKMKMEVMKIYTCPMHTDVTSKKPGTCPKCNMALTEVKTKNKQKKS